MSGQTDAEDAGGPNGRIGTKHPIVFRAAAPDKSWVIYCQARRDENNDGRVSVELLPHGRLGGDALQAYLNYRDRELPLQEVFAIDKAGRYIAYRQAGHPWLYDALQDQSLDLGTLGVDTASSSSPYQTHRSFSFDLAASRFSYLFWRDKQLTVGVLNLKSRRIDSFEPPPGSVFTQRLSADGELLVVHSVLKDTSGNGRPDWPVPPAKHPVPVCQPPVANFPAWLGYGDRTEPLVASVSRKSWQHVPGFVAPFGARLLVKEPSGRLVVDNEGTRYALTPPKCNAQVLHADPRRSLALVACPEDQTPVIKSPVFLVGPGLNQPLNIEVGPSGPLRWPEDSPRFVPLYPGSDVVVVDMLKRQLVYLKPGDLVITTIFDLVIIRRKQQLLLFNPETKTQKKIGPVDPLLDYAITEPWIWVRPWLVNLSAPDKPVKRARQALALSNDGSILVAESEASAQRVARGPLRWIPVEAP